LHCYFSSYYTRETDKEWKHFCGRNTSESRKRKREREREREEEEKERTEEGRQDWMKACQPPRHPLFIHAPEFGGPRDEIFPRTEDSHNETEPSLIGPFRPIKNEVPGGERGGRGR